MGKRSIITGFVALILLLTMIPLSSVVPPSSDTQAIITDTQFEAIIPAVLHPSLESVADAYINSGNLHGKYGSIKEMRAGTIILGGGGTTTVTTYRSLIRFDLSSIPSEATITSAGFNAYVNQLEDTPTIGLGRRAGQAE